MKILVCQLCEHQPDVLSIWEVDFINGKFVRDSFGAVGIHPEESGCMHGNCKYNCKENNNCEHFQRAKDLMETVKRNPEINGVIFVDQNIPLKIKEVSTLEEILEIKETCFLKMTKELNIYFPKFALECRSK